MTATPLIAECLRCHFKGNIHWSLLAGASLIVFYFLLRTEFVCSLLGNLEAMRAPKIDTRSLFKIFPQSQDPD